MQISQIHRGEQQSRCQDLHRDFSSDSFVLLLKRILSYIISGVFDCASILAPTAQRERGQFVWLMQHHEGAKGGGMHA